MKIAHQWLLEYVKTPTSPQELGAKFQMTSSVLEGLIDWEARLANIVVGKVITNLPHPNSQKLRVLNVSFGKKSAQILTAGHAPENTLVAVALPGAILHPLKGEPWEITEREMGGERSEGMLCGVEEMGLPIKVEGWGFIPPETRLGTPLSQVLYLNDTVLDLEVTPNRPDLLSHFGLAREVATFEKRSLQEPPIYRLDERELHDDIPFSVKVENSRICPRYSGIILRNITVQTSPLWLQARLIMVGIRPINTVVDVANYVMLELGQPLHTFDLKTLGNEGLLIRAAKKGERLTTLDGAERVLEAGDIVIANPNKPIDLAGVIGGLDSSITSETTDIFLESANFDGSSIRRTTRHLGLRTEASSRFEKGLDPEITVTALKRAIYLLQSISGAKVGSNLLDIYPRGRSERPRIHSSFARIQQVLGVHISAAETKSILQKLGFQLPLLTKSSFEVIPPSWRQDVELPEDIIEELVRLWGYDRLPITLPSGSVKAPLLNKGFEAKQHIRGRLAALGMHETIHLSFASTSDLKKIDYPLEKAIALPNPLSAEVAHLLPTYVISLLNNFSTVNREEEELAFFEIGTLFRAPQEEIPTLTLIWRSQRSYSELYAEAKRALCEVLDALNLTLPVPSSYQIKKDAASYYLASSALEITIDDKAIGLLGAIKPEVIEQFKIRRARQIVAMEIDLSKILTLPTTQLVYQLPLNYPSIQRDITLIVTTDLPVQSILDALKKEINPSITHTYLVKDIYIGKPLEVGKKSVTLHFTYNAISRTLEDQEVNSDQERLTSYLTNKLPVHLSA